MQMAFFLQSRIRNLYPWHLDVCIVQYGQLPSAGIFCLIVLKRLSCPIAANVRPRCHSSNGETLVQGFHFCIYRNLVIQLTVKPNVAITSQSTSFNIPPNFHYWSHEFLFEQHDSGWHTHTPLQLLGMNDGLARQKCFLPDKKISGSTSPFLLIAVIFY